MLVRIDNRQLLLVRKVEGATEFYTLKEITIIIRNAIIISEDKRKDLQYQSVYNSFCKHRAWVYVMLPLSLIHRHHLRKFQINQLPVCNTIDTGL